MEENEILKQAEEIIKAKNEERINAFQKELQELIAKYGIDLVPTIQIRVK